MKHSYSKVVATLLLGSSVLMAGNSLEESFKKGSVEGHVGYYGQQAKAKGDMGITDANGKDIKKEGFSGGSASISYETLPFYGISLGMGAWGSLKGSEKNKKGEYTKDGVTGYYAGDYEENIADKSIIHKAYIKGEFADKVKIIVGRQEVDFEWLIDYIEGVTAEIKPLENLTLTMAYTKKKATVGFDEVSKKFEDPIGTVTDEDGKEVKFNGVYMLDVKYSPLEWLELNPYYYHVNHILKAPGMKATLNFAPSEDLKLATILGYTHVKADIKGAENGKVWRAEQGVEFAGLVAKAGYIKVGKKGLMPTFETDAFGNITGYDEESAFVAFGDQNPLEEGEHVWAPDAKTPYLGLEYDLFGVKLAAMYSQTKYISDPTTADKRTEKELCLGVGYEIISNLEAEIKYVDIKNKKDGDDQGQKIVKAQIAYKF